MTRTRIAALAPSTVLAVIAALILGAAPPAFAYVGPGAGVSLIGSVVGLLAAIGTAIGFILLWPIRSFMKKRRARTAARQAGPGADDAGPQP